MISVIAVFPPKMGDLMFVGFDSQNTSQCFLQYSDWIFGFAESSWLRKKKLHYFFDGSLNSTDNLFDHSGFLHASQSLVEALVLD